MCARTSQTMGRAAERATKASPYPSVGTTTDGVRVLKPKTKSTHFTQAQIRAGIGLLQAAEKAKARSQVGAFVQQADDGSFLVEFPTVSSGADPSRKERMSQQGSNMTSKTAESVNEPEPGCGFKQFF